MDLEEVLDVLSDGHSIISVELAKEVCKVAKVTFNKKLIKIFKSDPPGTFKGLTMKPEYENTKGVYTLDLSGDVARQLGVKGSAGYFFGRGTQAKAYAKVIREKLQSRK